jgi:hypothetical protein
MKHSEFGGWEDEEPIILTGKFHFVTMAVAINGLIVAPSP